MGRFIIGMLGIIAALAGILYSATLSWHTAYAMTNEFQELAGWAAAGAVFWEALGALFVRELWRGRSYLLALGVGLLVFAAMIWLVRLDLRFNVSGQSDVTASRQASVDSRQMARIEYDKSVQLRDEIRKAKDPSKFQQRELEKAEKRIADLEPKLWKGEVVSSGSPDASWMSRMFSGESQSWADRLAIAGILFAALFRVFALPGAITYMQAVGRREPRTAQKTEGIIIVPPMPVPSPPVALEDFVRPSEPVSPPPPPTKPSPKKEEAEPVIEAPKYPILVDENFKKKGGLPKSIAKWRKDFLIEDNTKLSDGSYRHAIKGSDAWSHYSELPGLNEVKSQSGFGKKLAKMGVKRENRVNGVFYVGVFLRREDKAQVA